MSRRLLDPMTRKPAWNALAEFPFEWVPSYYTNVQRTWDRLCPGWRDRRKATVTPIRRNANERS